MIITERCDRLDRRDKIWSLNEPYSGPRYCQRCGSWPAHASPYGQLCSRCHDIAHVEAHTERCPTCGKPSGPQVTHTPPVGWICPRCHRTNAPKVEQCPCERKERE